MHKNNPGNMSLYAPRHWPVWLAVFILWLLVKLPLCVQQLIGKYLGLIILRFAKRERDIARINLLRCFPNFSDKKREKLLRNSFIAIGQGALETAFGWWASPKRLKKFVTVEGLENIQKALQKKRGALVFAPHFSCVHLAGRLSTLFQPFAVMFFPPKNAVINYISLCALQRHYQFAIPRNHSRLLIKALKKNLPVFYTPDTDPGLKNSIFAPFFGIATATVTATARLAQLSGCAVVPAAYYRLKKAKGYHIRFEAPLEHYPTGDAYNDALRINQYLEKLILEQPEQYLWQYKRFKTRPPGEEKFYPRR